MSIYKGTTKVCGTGVQLDNTLNANSNNAVTNATITNALEDVGYSTWQKPADWVDIRSGAIPNSVYFLVSHSADFSTYPLFSVYAEVSTAANTYDVFVDGVKQATTASGTVTPLNWQTLNLSSGWDTTHPSALRTHIVRVTPTTSTDTLTAIRCDESAGLQQGVLWVHFSDILNPIKIQRLVGTDQATGGNFKYMNKLCEAVTCSQEELKTVDSISGVVWHAEALEEFPVINLEQNGTTTVSTYRAFGYTKLKRIVIKNGVLNLQQVFDSCFYLKEIVFDNTKNTSLSGYTFNRVWSLKRLPPIKTTGGTPSHCFVQLSSLEDTFFDASYNNAMVGLDFYGASDYRIDGLKGVIVSNSAPFSSTTAPQLNVSYTGLDRAALVRLFNSMPYNVGYTVVGSPTITSGVASGFANNQGLSIPALSATGGNPFEMQIAFTAYSTTANALNILYTPSARIRFGVYSSNRPAFKFQNTGTTGETQVAFNTVISMNTKYTAKAVYDGTTVTCTLYNSSGTLIETKTSEGNYELYWNNGYFGYSSSSYFDGSIDLNNTYININGIPWFRGTAAMTKTCNVVGCTGTADLTQTDKDIVLDKGWSLIVQ